SAWPHLLSLRSKGAPIVLQPRYIEYKLAPPPYKAAVMVLWPAQSNLGAGGQGLGNEKLLASGPPWPDSVKTADGRLPEWVIEEGGKWVAYTGQTNYGFRYRARVDLIVVFDGEIIDTNRIAFPKGAPVVAASKYWDLGRPIK